MKINEFIGTWESIDFPLYVHNDNISIRLYIHTSLTATLWLYENNNLKTTKTFSEGKVSIEVIKNDKFKFVIDGKAIDPKFLELNARMYMDRTPKSVLITIPEYGERYFQKFE